MWFLANKDANQRNITISNNCRNQCPLFKSENIRKRQSFNINFRHNGRTTINRYFDGNLEKNAANYDDRIIYCQIANYT